VRTKSPRSLLKLSKRATELDVTNRPASGSIQLLKDGLARRGISRRQFVQEAELSYEYVSRVFNNKVKFPSTRETLEKFASIIDADPMIFSEYRKMVESLPSSTKKLWEIMSEKGVDRRDLAEVVNISRTYLYEILRGDVSFPNNPEVIEAIASAVSVTPDTFDEYLRPVIDWSEQNPKAIEMVFLNLLSKKMLISRGYMKAKNDPSCEISDYTLSLFEDENSCSKELIKVYQAMGKNNLDLFGISDLLEIRSEQVWNTFSGQKVNPHVLAMMKKALKVK